METHSVSTVSIEDMPSQPQPILLPISRLVSTTLVLAFVAAPFLYAGVNVSMLSVAPTLSSISTVWDEHSKAMALEGSWTGTASTARTRREVSINRYVCVCVCVCVCVRMFVNSLCVTNTVVRQAAQINSTPLDSTRLDSTQLNFTRVLHVQQLIYSGLGRP